MREKKSGALSKVQKIKKRLSHSFGRLCKYYIKICVLIIIIIICRYKVCGASSSLRVYTRPLFR